MWQDESEDSSSHGSEEDVKQTSNDGTIADVKLEVKDGSSTADHDSDYENPEEQGIHATLLTSVLLSEKHSIKRRMQRIATTMWEKPVFLQRLQLLMLPGVGRKVDLMIRRENYWKIATTCDDHVVENRPGVA